MVNLVVFLNITVLVASAAPGHGYGGGGIKGAYWPSWLAETLPPSNIPTTYFNHLFYAFVVPDATSFQLSIPQPDDQWMGNFTAKLHNKKPSAMAFLSIGGGASSPYTFSNMVSNRQNRVSFIQSTVTVARKYGFDSLDLDWEFPNNQQDMANLAILFKEWRAAVDQESAATGKPRILLSAAVYFSSHFFLTDPPRNYPGSSIRKSMWIQSIQCVLITEVLGTLQ